MEGTELYKEDRIGLRELDEEGRLFRLHLPGLHMQVGGLECVLVVGGREAYCMQDLAVGLPECGS
jgi:hypothetical protein